MLACIVQYIGLIHYLYFMTVTVSSQIGIHLLFTTFHKELKKNLKSINGNIKLKHNQSEISKHFIDMIEFHSILIQLSFTKRQSPWCNITKSTIFFLYSSFLRLGQTFSKIVEPIFTTIFTGSFITICGAMLIINLEIVKVKHRLDLRSNFPIKWFIMNFFFIF